MNSNEIIKQFFEYNKAGHQQFIASLTDAHQQAGEITEETLKQTVFIPETGKQFVHKWLKLSRSGIDNYKSIVEKGHAQIKNFIDAA